MTLVISTSFRHKFQKSFLFQAQYAKSLPSLSSYLSSKGRSAIIQLEPKLEHGNSEQNGKDSWRKSRQCSTENIVSNGAKSNAFKSATQKYSMLPNNNKVCTLIVEFRYFFSTILLCEIMPNSCRLGILQSQKYYPNFSLGQLTFINNKI